MKVRLECCEEFVLFAHASETYACSNILTDTNTKCTWIHLAHNSIQTNNAFKILMWSCVCLCRSTACLQKGIHQKQSHLFIRPWNPHQTSPIDLLHTDNITDAQLSASQTVTRKNPELFRKRKRILDNWIHIKLELVEKYCEGEQKSFVKLCRTATPVIHKDICSLYSLGHAKSTPWEHY